MKISNKTTYGLRFMLNLSVSFNNESFIKLPDVSKAENISEKFLESIVSLIKAKGLIKVKRGTTGGYQLAKSPEQISILEIFEALEGPVNLSEPIDRISPSDELNKYVIHSLWNELNKNITIFLKYKTLADLVKEFGDKNKTQMFYI